MFTESEKSFISVIESKFGKDYVISRKEIDELYNENKPHISYPYWLTKEPYKVGWGKFKVPSFDTVIESIMPNSNPVIENVVAMKKPVQEHKESISLIPEKDPNYISWGFHSDLKNIIKSGEFYPVFIFGESGFGKNMMVEQICAQLKRELIRFNFSPETDLVSLVGGPTLVNGNIVFQDGPVLTAMKRGAVLFLDEFAKGHSGNMLVLNSILEGKSYLVPHTGEYVEAKPGFNVIAASNSSGRGEDTGRYIEQMLDSSLLERFPITVIQEQPTVSVETKILSNYCDDKDFVEKLVKWSNVVYKTYENGGISEMISIRRLVHICKAYKIFNNKLKAITLCTNRFDTEIRLALTDLYTKIDNNIEFDEEGNPIENVKEEIHSMPDDIAF